MAGSAFAPSRHCPVRTNSLPSESHPVELRVEEELHKLRTCIAAATSSTSQMIPDALRELAALYESMEELLCLPSNQQTLISSSEKNWLEEELECSIRLLDMCCALKESLSSKKEHIKHIESALRRRDDAAIKSKAITYVRFDKKANKDMKKCFGSLKHVESWHIDTNSNQQTVRRSLMEAKSITVSLLQLVLSSSSTQTGRQTSSRWSFVAKALSKSRVAKGELENGVELRILDSLSFSECISCKDVDDQRVQKLQKQLQTLELSAEGLENGLESLFKQLIRSRVTLLNILSS